MNLNKLKERAKKKWVIIGVAGLVYNAVSAYGIHIPDATFKLIVDLASYVLMGYAVYTNHDEGGTGEDA